MEELALPHSAASKITFQVVFFQITLFQMSGTALNKHTPVSIVLVRTTYFRKVPKLTRSSQGRHYVTVSQYTLSGVSLSLRHGVPRPLLLEVLPRDRV